MDDTYNGWTNRETWAAHLWKDIGSLWRINWREIVEALREP